MAITTTGTERAKKAAELDKLLRTSEAFSKVLAGKTKILGRAGHSLDGQDLGKHDVELTAQPKMMTGGTMHDYQLAGLTWMTDLFFQGMSGILADEMGLGKTIQTIGLICWAREEDCYGPHLIVAPLSTLKNWTAEIKKWSPTLPVIEYHGTKEERAQIFQDDIWAHYDQKSSSQKATHKFPVVCTSYEMVLRDVALLKKIEWAFCIIDEGHRLKNVDSQLFKELKQFKNATRILITGTPLQNNLKELWSLLNFLMPQVFTNWDAFESWFDFSDLQDEKGTERFISDKEQHELLKKMHIILQPLMIRRIKADVAAYLPKKREYVLYAPMTKQQTDLYKVIQDKGTDTRKYLESKVRELFAGSGKNGPAEELDGFSLAIRSSSRVKPMQESAPRSPFLSPELDAAEPAAPANAFAKMMKRGRGRPPKAKPAVETSPSANGKRKEPPTSGTPSAKSTKSSRQSTPASTRETSRGRGRPRRGRPSYKDAQEEEDDQLDDEQFEALLAEEAAEQEEAQRTMGMDAEKDVEPSGPLEAALREVKAKKLGNPTMQLRLVCNSPHNFINPWPADDTPVDETIVTASGKLLLLDRLLPELFRRGHRVLIFSQFKTQLDILERFCGLREWLVCRINGGIDAAERQGQIDLFNSTDEYKVFLLTTRAGGQGINLASADTVILFDSDWNPQQDLQAQDRVHRIGQTKPVIIYRLTTNGTVEEALRRKAEGKRRLEKLVVRKGDVRQQQQQQQQKQNKKKQQQEKEAEEQDEGNDDDDVVETLDSDALRKVLLADGHVYRTSGGADILSDRDLEVLCDRSDEAYDNAVLGRGGAEAYDLVETRADGFDLGSAKSEE